MTTLGAVFLPQLPPERLRSVVTAADAAGLEELWLWEDCFLEGGLTTAAAALAWSSNLRVGVGLLPVPLRNVAVAAMEVATLFRLFPGRPIITVGHGVQDWMGQVGARAESPLTLLREYTLALRALLAGARVSTQGRYVRLDDVALDWPPTGPAPILVGATGPKSIRLSGEVGDGTLLTAGTDVAGVRRARALADEGRTAAGRTDPSHLVVYLHCATGPDATARLAAERTRWGYADDLDVMAAGDEHAVAARVRQWAEAGADRVILQPTADDPDPEGFVRFVAERVRPLVER
ncbi:MULTISPECIES: LLM class flavin-dependent oxidoreductase [Dactylosporangium]|uniref:Oxidoreductase n=2 Tax=Dactylosporangium TaxID=35753 RepID=A0A9W6KIP0_9ACTN|nr:MULTISPECIES: LLM class flavin-dependent oxidoreductase [Dactylosporangium]UAB98381.1 LLM class flavin-dependent oxidoreductase [Dactylosporangium vinaceum]UWZ46631.1 LLM class flavin-dependent oxidoreductase [Dactylosporangium matsuzakiense]GLL01234.1 oxidoreductase [Dactylosporangium matsuzakiense]